MSLVADHGSVKKAMRVVREKQGIDGRTRVQHHIPTAHLRIWKHSHGTASLSSEERLALTKRSVLTIYRDTGKKQGKNFRGMMQPGDYVYLCHGNDVQLFGQVTSGIEKSDAKWVERRYRPIQLCQRKDSTYQGPKKYWAPNANSTSKLVPLSELESFERLILKRFFRFSLNDLRHRLLDDSLDESLFEMLSAVDNEQYEEARHKLILHEGLERRRNKELVSDAKARFKEKHHRMFCEVCGFDYSNKYGNRGIDFIEAHHRIPIAELKANTLLGIKDLAMVCANCHRMLHRHPWISVERLRATIELDKDAVGNV